MGRLNLGNFNCCPDTPFAEWSASDKLSQTGQRHRDHYGDLPFKSRVGAESTCKLYN